MAIVAVAPLQAFIDEHEALTPEEWNALDPPPDIEPAQTATVEAAQAAVERGCSASATEASLQEAIDGLTGDGEVGQAIAAALRGDGPLLGPLAPSPTTTTVVDTEPTTVSVAVGDSLPNVLDRVAPGSTIRFEAGIHRFVEPILIDKELSFVGAGQSATTLSSSAEGVAIAFVGPGGFTMSDLSVEHAGDREANVFVAIEGPVTLRDVGIRGGTSGGEEGAGGGHGIVFAFEPLPGFPERTPAERAGPLSITDSTVSGNDAAGILVTGSAAPQILTSTISRNGACGLCYTGSSGGSLVESDVVANTIGIQVDGTASPSLRDNSISLSVDVGVTAGDESAPLLISNVIDDNGEIGIQAAGSAEPYIEANTIRRHGVGVLGAESARPRVERNLISDHDIGLQFGGDVEAGASRNILTSSAIAAISFGDSSRGVADGNEIRTAAEVAIQAVDESTAEIVDNVVSSPGGVGISALGASRSTVAGNTVSERDVGIQIGATAVADVRDNVITAAGAVGVLVSDGAAATIVDNEISGSDGVGVLASGASAPAIERNRIFDNGVGLVLREGAAGSATDNTIERHVIGVQVVDRAAGSISGNTVVDSVEAGVVFGGSSTTRFEKNTLARNGSIALQIGEEASPVVAENEIRGQGIYGILLRDRAAGSIVANRIVDHVFAIQLGDSAAPEILDNRLEQIALTNIVYADSTGGRVAGNNCAESLSAGISVTAPADPEIGDNECTISRTAG